MGNQFVVTVIIANTYQINTDVETTREIDTFSEFIVKMEDQDLKGDDPIVVAVNKVRALHKEMDEQMEKEGAERDRSWVSYRIHSAKLLHDVSHL